MLSKAQERILRDLQIKKGRKARGLCIIEGAKFVRDAASFVEFAFTPRDTNQFREYVTTVTPQAVAAVARVPAWTLSDVLQRSCILILDGVQDPGNVGTVLRLALGFGAAVVLVESADVTNQKTVRASASALFAVPWVEVRREDAEAWLRTCDRPMYRLEHRPGSVTPEMITKDKVVIVAGNEGSGIHLAVPGASVRVPHDTALESLNVASALAITLYVYRRAQ